MKWIERFTASVERNAKSKIAEQVTRGAKDVPVGSTKKIRREQSDWIASALNTLDALADEPTRTKILVETCPHTYPKARIKEMKKKFSELGSIDRLLEFMRLDTSWRGGSYYGYIRRDGVWIHITKVPYNPEGYEAASTVEGKMKAYCHCSIAKSNFHRMPSTFCCCAGGWEKQHWEGILETQLEVVLSESLLKGDSKCTHSFRIPDGLTL
ncbi:MAG: hypothetical protein JW779_08690 [Candidatus Thorarchaeota archaeon]|nr:hypothetical protein [Candidatus Thorarchaeota archaeon]